jgi:F420-dependent methylenetetrahydromethanopterin dehydrogenase
MRILVALEVDFRAYQDVIAAAIRVLRPHAGVQTTTLDALTAEVERFDPEVVVCSRPNFVNPGGSIAWIELSIISTQPSKVCISGRYLERSNPTVEELLTLIDEGEELSQTNSDLKGC